MMQHLYAIAAVVIAAGPAFCAPTAATLPLEDAIRLEAQSVAKGKPMELKLPALPARAGKVVALRFKAVITCATEGGCNWNASVLVNGKPLERRTAGGLDRLVGREGSLELSAQRNLCFPVFSGEKLMMMFAPTPAQGDTMSTDGLGATFLLDISDLTRAAEANTLTFRNENPAAAQGGYGLLRVEGIEVGWLDRSAAPPPPNAMPQRGPVAGGVAAGDLTLAQSPRGGFVVRRKGGPELLVETGLGMKADAPPLLVADDAAAPPPGLKLTVEPWGPAGYRLTATWPDLSLTRTIRLTDGLVEWKERWTNTGSVIRGVPLRHRVFLRSGTKQAWLGGSAENLALGGSAPNPTLFLESADGAGMGVTAESDWLRLLLALRYHGGIGEVYSDTLALAPKSSVDFDLTITPGAGTGVPPVGGTGGAPVGAGGYWAFLNKLRDRWGVNEITQERAVFWGYAHATGAGTPDELTAKSLAHLGPIYVVIGPWQRLEPDARVVMAGQYPRLPAAAPRTPGACPDLDVDAFLTFAHREPYWQAMKTEAERIRRVAPQAKVMNMLHPSMEAVYRPLQDRWPNAAEAIQTPDGKAFEDGGYSRSWLGDMAGKDWGVLYYVPRPGSNYLRQILDGVRRGLDECGLDGAYCDEFSWAYSSRGYSRYDYSRWDGRSADLDENGNVLRLKADNGSATESCQLQMINMVLGRGKYFLNNGGNALRSVGSQPHARFVEGGNGTAQMGQGHLSPTPLVLGNMGDETTRKGVLKSVRVCLGEGSLYSPFTVNLLLEGADNFVCKLYPITVQELGPGWIIGRERLITSVSRAFPFPREGCKLRLYRYDSEGNLLQRGETATIEAGKEFAAQVPEGGLVIAER